MHSHLDNDDFEDISLAFAMETEQADRLDMHVRRMRWSIVLVVFVLLSLYVTAILVTHRLVAMPQSFLLAGCLVAVMGHLPLAISTWLLNRDLKCGRVRGKMPVR
ncbi:hypothetical protein ACOI1H_16150 [Loktanella sp. DJP18]|uniref:hypothetical protein n=1 Tax=Loktanella sp. DJP18 TaxID=3409788 RepID=UPI003BB59BCA